MKKSMTLSSISRQIPVLLGAVLIHAAGVEPLQAFDQSHAGYDRVLKTFVADGRVNYSGLKYAPKELETYLQNAAGVSEEQFNAWTVSQQLAFLINLYNAGTLKLIIDHYPIKSIKDIGYFFKGPWDQKIVGLFGKTVTLNHIEHDILRKQYNEPRIHMALVCAAKGCPRLHTGAYLAETLDSQLNDQSRDYLLSPAGLGIDHGGKAVFFSSIFKWYGEDYIAKYSPNAGFAGLDKTERAVANFCSAYLDSEDRSFLSAGGYSVKYLDYDWSLNGK